MKIIYPISIFPKLSETFILEQITSLIDLGHEVKIVAFHRPEEEINHPQIEKYDLLAKTLYVSKNGTEVSLEFTDELIEFLHGADLIHSHFAALPTEFALRAYHRLGIPYVFTTHAYDIFVHITPERLTKYAESAQSIITVSQFNRQYMLKMIGERFRNKIKIIRCGIDIQRFQPEQRPVSKQVTILAIGRFVEKKGLAFAIEAFRKLPEKCKAVFRIVGDGPLKGELERLIEQAGMVDKVMLLGGVSQASVIEEMQRADIFLLPSITAANNDREGLPVVLLEAQAMKLPVVSTYHTGIPEGVLDGTTGFLATEKDVDALAEKLLMLVNDHELRLRMGESGRQHVADHFGISTEMEKLERILLAAATASRDNQTEKAQGANIQLELERSRAEQLAERLQAVQQEYAEQLGLHQQRIWDLEHSLSWRLTAPVRAIVDLLKK